MNDFKIVKFCLKADVSNTCAWFKFAEMNKICVIKIRKREHLIRFVFTEKSF